MCIFKHILLLMKNFLLLFAMSLMLSSVTYASFPITQPVGEVVITKTVEPIV